VNNDPIFGAGLKIGITNRLALQNITISYTLNKVK